MQAQPKCVHLKYAFHTKYLHGAVGKIKEEKILRILLRKHLVLPAYTCIPHAYSVYILEVTSQKT